MKSRTITQYACDFCNKKKYTKHAMIHHEKHCTMNPDRECRVCDELGESYDIKEIVASLPKPIIEKERICETYFSKKIINSDEIQKAFDSLEINCPACSLAVIRQSGIQVEYDYKAHSKEVRESILEERRYDYACRCG